MNALKRLGTLAAGAGLAASTAATLSCAPLLIPGLTAPARAQETPGLMEFRWDSDRDYRKLYFFLTDGGRNRQADYYLILRPRDRKTAFLKLSVDFPNYWDAPLNAKTMELCEMKEGGMTSRTRCEKTIPAVIEVSPNGRVIEVYPNTPVPDNKTIGLYFRTTNPFNSGMFNLNARIQPPGDIPVSTYLGTWLIQIDPN
jgi:hypothetical protein